MSIGERIALLRKEQGLSQEAFGEVLGVSRQAISKWEAGQSLPDLDKLVQLHELYGVSVGWLVGTEQERTTAGEMSRQQLDMVEAIAKKYIEAMPMPEPPAPDNPKRKRWMTVCVVALVALAIVGGVKLSDRLNGLSNQQQNMQYQVEHIQQNVSNQLYGVTHQVEELLKKQNALLIDFGAAPIGADLRAGTIDLEMHASPRTYVPGMTLEFLIEDGTGTRSVMGTEGDSRNFTAQAQCALTDHISVYAVIHTGSTEQKQLVQTLSYELGKTYLEAETHHWSTTLWCTKVEEIQRQSWLKTLDLDTVVSRSYPVYGKQSYTVEPESVEFQIFVNGELTQRLPGREGCSDYRINDMTAMEYYAQSGEIVFTAKLDTAFIGEMQVGDRFAIIPVITDNYGRTYTAGYQEKFIIGDDLRVDFDDGSEKLPVVLP